MGLGGYLAARIDAEHYASEYGRERRETFDVPTVETEEVARPDPARALVGPREQVGRDWWALWWRSGGKVLRDRSNRWAPNEEPRRLVPVGVANASVLGLTASVLPQPPNECSQVRQMHQRDLAGGGQML
jgi:hypothetical protein